ncbi:MAG: ABC transporter substrate-binding protein [Gammaproteobacteria bacterium]|nr:ABC transporter substrate-binding protein [Gammaproteobacteria bacterium]
MSPRSISLLVMALYFWVAGALAQTSAYEIVDATSAQVMAVVQAAEAYADEDPERYYQQIEALLDPLIDYRGFSRSVMGAYASSRRYKSLDEAERAQLRDQLDRFTQVMRASLVRTYSKGLLAFGGSRIEVVPSEDDVPGAKRVSVRQNVFADRDDPYVVFYQMGLDQSDEWKLRNVIIESVNLGEIYRDQFQASAREENGDLDAVIAKWTVVTVDVDA